jgi:hypothetical protein
MVSNFSTFTHRAARQLEFVFFSPLQNISDVLKAILKALCEQRFQKNWKDTAR